MRSSGAEGFRNVQSCTEGGCIIETGVGGWAAMLRESSESTEISEVEHETTDQRMKLKAAIESLK